MLETILVIDDDSDARQSLALTLESRDYLVFSAAGEDTAIIMARRVNPKIIYINLAVAGGKGLEICKKIHGTDQLKNVPVIVLSAFDGAKDPKFTNLYGIVDSLQKPFSAEDIFAKTEHALSIKPADMQPVVPEAGPAEEEFSKDTEEDSDIPPERQTESLSPENPPDYVLERETPVEQVSPNTTRRAVRTRHQTRLPFALIAAVVVVMLGAVGFMFYDGGSLFEKILGKTDKPVQPSRQQTVQSNPAADIQQPPQSTGPIQPLAKPESVPAPPVAREKAPNPDPVKPEMAVKPEAKSRT
ncbi:MAG TPA: response regulator, partial [Thermodesulfovibrionales bacterium]|nr:response regulator [Thermodesulfovibrionales bacterium]